MRKIKLAFHVHSCYSLDSWSKPEDIVNFCRENNIEAIAICDHNEIKGAVEAQKISEGNPKVIIGEEIKTTSGEIIGLFLNKKIEKNLTLSDTINQIKRQGGLVCIPHPGETLRREAIKRNCIKDIILEVDIIEAYNARTIFPKDNCWAEEVAKLNSKPRIAGSDAHFIYKISSAINLIDDFKDSTEFLNTLKKGQFLISKSFVEDQLLSKIIKLLGKIKRLIPRADK